MRLHTIQIIAIFGLALLAFSTDPALAVKPLGGAANAEPFYYEFRGPLDEGVWVKARYTFDGNGTVSRPEMVVSMSDRLALAVKKLAQPEEGRLYQAGGLSSRRLFSYGAFTVRMRVPTAPGLVGSFFLMNPWKPGHWLHQDIDIEFLGRSRNAIQLTTHKYFADTGNMSTSDAFVYTSDFDYGNNWHDYTIVWGPKKVAWLIDGKQVRETLKNIPAEAMNILMNHWLLDPKSSWAAGWLGPFDETALPVSAEYLWVRYDPLKKAAK